jgi:hypothetical protein
MKQAWGWGAGVRSKRWLVALPSSSARSPSFAGVLADDRADVLYHRYEAAA